MCNTTCYIVDNTYLQCMLIFRLPFSAVEKSLAHKWQIYASIDYDLLDDVW